MKDRLDTMIRSLQELLLSRRDEKGTWRGHLSSSAISTSVSVYALYRMDPQVYAREIAAGTAWLQTTMRPDGTWGDSPASPSNMTATLLSYAALYALGKAPEQTQAWLNAKLGGIEEETLIRGVLDYYGKDLTFSVPILAMCALTGVISNWRKVPVFPFELAALPQKFFRFLQLPVVSYAVPALIAVGLLRNRRGRRTPMAAFRSLFTGKCLRVLAKMQPEDGGFLEAAPLTAFVCMCLNGAGLGELEATKRCANFLVNTIREDGSWPIDTDLATWVTTLSVKALQEEIPNPETLLQEYRSRALRTVHPFTGAQPGGWGWTDLSGSVPDADDTPGALIALHILSGGKSCPEVEGGVKWLLDLQNRDGGIPTFCKGWTRLPFDASSPDLTAHTLRALTLWEDSLPAVLRSRVDGVKSRMYAWLRKVRRPDGSWVPLWFGCQDAPDEKAPVYGTALVADYLTDLTDPEVEELLESGCSYLLKVQNPDGGWGGAEGLPSRVTFTAKAVAALTQWKGTPEGILEKGLAWLEAAWKNGHLLDDEPIGLYFARLWYSEDMYNLTFTLDALKKARKRTYGQ